MPDKKTADYGSWASPVTADLLARAGTRLGWLQAAGSDLYWVEARPLEEGRHVIVRCTGKGHIEDITPAGYNVRTLVHEYGGGMYVLHGRTVYFSSFDDQRLYRQEPDGAPRPITPEPPASKSLRYADGRLTPDGKTVICVRESHTAGAEAKNELVALPPDGSTEPVVIASGHDFYAAPRPNPDGTRLAWLCWDHPRMPWDGCELWTAVLGEHGALQGERRVAGGESESIFQPEWSPEGELHFVSDRSGWWNLFRERDGKIEPTVSMHAEFGQPQWAFGFSRYAFLEDGRIACIYSRRGFDYIGLVDPRRASLQTVPVNCTVLSWLCSDGKNLWVIGTSPTEAQSVYAVDPGSGKTRVLRSSLAVHVDQACFSQPRAVEFPTGQNRTAHALYYAPVNPDFTGPSGEKPPLIVISHGGPTGVAQGGLSLPLQYWTSRVAGGDSYCGVADCMGLAVHTEKFDARYLGGLAGP